MGDYEKHVDTLIQACMDDLFPTDIDCLRTFMFDRLSSIEEATNLLGLYIGLVKLHPDFEKQDLIQAISSGKLTNYIINMHLIKHKSYYSQWFFENKERFM